MLSARTLTGSTPLHFAADGHTAQQCIDVVDLLLSSGVDINECTNDCYTVLHLSVTSYTLNKVEFISFLLEKGADVNGYSSSHPSRKPSSRSALRQEGDSVSVESEIPSKEMVNTPLHLSLDGERADFNIVYFLLDKGADLDTRDRTGRTALLRCVIGYEATPIRLEIAQELIRRGANMEAMDNFGRKFDAVMLCIEPSWG